MRTLTDYHNKHVLVSGQGAAEEIGKMIGFKSITTIEKVCEAFLVLINDYTYLHRQYQHQDYHQQNTLFQFL
ncbi:unnamed protein product, partial [Rotaria sp. Silwood1]